MKLQFSSNPIKVYYTDTLIVFIGSVPDEVRKELSHIKNITLDKMPVSKFKHIREFYGKNWVQKLGLIRGKHGGDTDIYGGSDTDDIQQIEALLNIPHAPSKIRTKSKPNLETKITGVNDVKWIFDYTVYPFDKVSEFKEKIYVATGVEPYQQHVWFNERVSASETHPHPIAYNVIIENEYITPNLTDHIEDTKTQVDGIPVNMLWFHKKDDTYIQAYDEFKVMNEYYTEYNCTTFYLMSLAHVIPKIAIKELEIVYYGFIQIFFPMISSLSVFKRYMDSSSDEWASEYTLLSVSSKKLHDKFIREQDIILHSYDLAEDKAVHKFITSNILTSITSALITLQPLVSNLISLRNIFDRLVLTKSINYARADFLHNNKRYEIRKRHISVSDELSEIVDKEKLTMGSLLVNIQMSEDSVESIYVIIFQHGTVLIKSWWREEYYYGFEEIFDIVHGITKPLFTQVNNMKEYAFGSIGAGLPKFVWENTKFSEIDMSLFWKQPVTSKQFIRFLALIHKYEEAGFVESINVENTEFIYKKGMFQFDPNRINKMISITNQYDHLTDAIVNQKWTTLFSKMRRMLITHRFSDIRLGIIGIREQEYEYFSDMMKILMYMFYIEGDMKPKRAVIAETKAKTRLETEAFNEILSRRQKKTLYDLKEKDPELYNTKKLYGQEDAPYSKICQKPFQPVTLEPHEIQYLNPEGRRRAIKYYNFTTHRDIFYYCPQEKYPWIKFLTHKHPKGYCIPCCKKTPPAEDTDTLKELIHDTCLETHEYTEEKKTLTEGSRYITTYGRSIDAGRLSNLPEGGLSDILISKLRLQQKSASRCNTNEQKTYYVVGVPQNHPSRSLTGMLFCLSDALTISPSEFLETVANNASRQRNQLRFTELYSIANISTSTLAHTKATINITEEIQSLALGIDWNKALSELAFLFMNVNVLILEDPGDNTIQLVAPYQTSERMFPEGYKTLIVIHNLKADTYYPMYELVSETFFKTGIIDTRLYDNNHVCIRKLSVVINKQNSTTTVVQIGKSKFDLDVLEMYIGAQNMWKISGIYVNKANMCYLVQLTMTSIGFIIHIPVEESVWKGSQHKIITGASKFPSYGTYKNIHVFTTGYEKWVAKMSAKNKMTTSIYPLLTPQYVLHYEGKACGFTTAGNLNFYCTGIPNALKIGNVLVQTRTYMYDPIKINTLLMNARVETRGTDWRTQHKHQVTKSVYLFRMFITEVYYWFMKKRNTAMRTKVKAAISKTNFDKSPDTATFYTRLGKLTLDVDDHKSILDVIQKHKNRAKILEALDLIHFKFDDSIRELKTLSKEAVTLRLKKDLRHLFTFSESHTLDDLPDLKSDGSSSSNIIIPCFTNNDDQPFYCSSGSGKLTLQHAQYDQFVEYLAYLITSPLLNRNIFSSVDINNTIDFFDFEQRSTEIIS